ncbi:o-succinylbenzoate synthase [Brasilonema sp. UFV-L1]|uniref:o-succinylbenzoate synthase n=1 Tax=Brasilonema sp. UFV-L1 TaxID=2234130 RepID=UPI00145E94E5|nr:o-succinylbenzoate synthase [Brasilonema sp. UFV-L1]NMG09039.1 o-succinylbenzoate synthase [Brasilonema sp. UFV-L1]
MAYRFEFRPYRQKFLTSLTTSHGTWDIREGIILRLSDETGKIGWGEIAPISWFGSETLEQALEFCCQLPEEITQETIFSIPDELSACQFGFESAWETNRQDAKGAEKEEKEENLRVNNLSYSGLMPAGEAALQIWEKLWYQGYSSFKWKIGVYPMAKELEILEQLAQSLPASAKLRLDANGGLSYEEAQLWLRTCDNIKVDDKFSLEIEFLEQPLSVKQFQAMLELSHCYQTAIALDESVATLNQLVTCFKQGWRGIFVIKPGIVGSPSRLRQFCQQHQIDAVFSSVFETAIGRQAALKLAAQLSQRNRAVGFGVKHWFVQQETLPEDLWKKL